MLLIPEAIGLMRFSDRTCVYAVQGTTWRYLSLCAQLIFSSPTLQPGRPIVEGGCGRHHFLRRGRNTPAASGCAVRRTGRYGLPATAGSKEPDEYREIMDQMVETSSDARCSRGFLDMTEKADFSGSGPATWGLPCRGFAGGPGRGRACGNGRRHQRVHRARIPQQARATANDEQRLAIAKAFGVSEEVLTGYDIMWTRVSTICLSCIISLAVVGLNDRWQAASAKCPVLGAAIAG